MSNADLARIKYVFNLESNPKDRFVKIMSDALESASAAAAIATNSNETTGGSTSLAHFLEVENIGYIIDPRDRQNVLQKDDNKEVARQVQDLVLGQQRVLHYVILDKKNRKMFGGKLSRNVRHCVCCQLSQCCEFPEENFFEGCLMNCIVFTCWSRFNFDAFITNVEMVLQYESMDGPRQQRMELEKPVEIEMETKACRCWLKSALCVCCCCCVQMYRFEKVKVKIFPYLIFVQPPFQPPTAPPGYAQPQ